MLNIYVNTWGNYNENGAEGGEWIALPMDSDELEETLERIANKMGDSDPEWAIHDYEWEDGFCFCIIHELDDINELNELCDDLEALDEMDIRKLDAIMESETNDLREALDNLDNYTLYEDMDLEAVAEQIVNECYDLPEFALRYFDYEAFARDLRFDGYVETSYGVLCR